MTTRTKSSAKTGKKVKVGKLKINKQTVKNLTDSEKRGIKGGEQVRRRIELFGNHDSVER